MVKRILVLLVVALVLLSGTCLAAEWCFVIESQNGKKYVDLDEIRYLRTPYGIDKDIIEAWIKIDYSDTGKSEQIKFAKDNNYYNKKWDTVSHALIKHRFNINTREYAVIYGADYAENGELLFDRSFTPNYKPVIPDSSGAYIFEVIEISVKTKIVK